MGDIGRAKMGHHANGKAPRKCLLLKTVTLLGPYQRSDVSALQPLLQWLQVYASYDAVPTIRLRSLFSSSKRIVKVLIVGVQVCRCAVHSLITKPLLLSVRIVKFLVIGERWCGVMNLITVEDTLSLVLC